MVENMASVTFSHQAMVVEHIEMDKWMKHMYVRQDIMGADLRAISISWLCFFCLSFYIKPYLFGNYYHS